MNHRLAKLQPYPFEQFNALLANVTPNPALPLIAWSIGEPRHTTADFLIEMSQDEQLLRQGFGTYPPTRGYPELRAAIAGFINRRFSLTQSIDPDTQILPVNGTREALFAFAQAVIGPTQNSLTLMPNPFYQIYEGAALLAGSEPYYLNCHEDNGFEPDWSAVSDDVWARCELLYICTPGNPTGSVMSVSDMQTLIGLSDEHDFIIASDECYSEIYLDESKPPAGLLEAASAMGRHDFKNCVAFNSLSKRSNLPGLRSGYVAGDAAIIEKFLLYRTYHGSAMPGHHQLISARAWSDDQHVIDNRSIYKSKFNAVQQILEPVWHLPLPDAGFYFWAKTPMADTDFAIRLIELANVKVLPGSFLSRDTAQANPGKHRVRMALVATEEECTEAAQRILDCWSRI